MTEITVSPAGSVQTITATVTSAELLAIFTTAVTIVPAPGAGKFIAPISSLFEYVAGATPYTDHGGSLVLHLAGAETGAWSGPFASLATLGFWDQAASQLISPAAQSVKGYGAEATNVNTALVLRQDTANPTAGDGTLRVTVAYTLVPIV